MSGKTGISWTTSTWNPLTGCTRVTPGCEHCYAFTLHNQRHTYYVAHGGVYPDGRPMPKQYAKPFSEIQLLPQRLNDPLEQKKPCMYFVNSMSDLFHSHVPDDYIQQVFDVMQRAHWHIFQILTKRGNRLQRLAPSLPWPANVWMGVSIELDRLTPRANQLRKVPAAIRFLSCEPLLEPLPSLNLEGIQWVIVGGESGKGYRPIPPDGARDLRDRCLASDIALFYKQGSGSRPGMHEELDGRKWQMFPTIRTSAI